MSLAHLTIRALTRNDAPRVAALHIEAIDTGFISSLGPGFVTTLYQTLALDGHAFGWVADSGVDLQGFIAFTADIGALYRSVLRKGGLRLLGQALPHCLSRSNGRRIVETLRYPRRLKRYHLPRAELLALAVARARQGQGIGRRLVQQGLATCCQRGFTQLKVCVGDNRAAALALYADTGFQPVCDLRHHGRTSRIYVKDLRTPHREQERHD